MVGSDTSNIAIKNKPDYVFSSGLYIVATPIGNLRDITLRAIDVLNASDLIACEDTRVSQRLLNEYGITKKLVAYNDHNAERVRPGILKLLKEGKIVSLVSDAGTPLISDPGYKLLKEARENRIAVTSLPGACSVITALTLSSQGTDSFFFDGFLPSKSQSRKNRLEDLKNIKSTLIFFERAERVPDTIKDIIETLGERYISIARELTKKFEEVIEAPSSQLIEDLKLKDNLLGEVVLLVGPSIKTDVENITNLDSEIAELKSQNIPSKLISELLAKKYDLPKKQVYSKINELKK